MSNQKNNDAEKAIIKMGKIFKIFALVVVVLIIALCIYLASHSEPKVSLNLLAGSLQIVEIFIL